MAALFIDATSGVDTGSPRYSVVDDHGTVQPSGPVRIFHSDGRYDALFSVSLEAKLCDGDQSRNYRIMVNVKDKAGNLGTVAVLVSIIRPPG